MNTQKKYLFIDRDGTLVFEPEDKQIDSIEKLELVPGVIQALSKLQSAGYKLIMISNQDGLGTESLPWSDFDGAHNLMLKIFKSQGIEFNDILICPHLPDDNCDCRKPKIGLLLDYLKNQIIDNANSYVIGDRETDLQLAENMGVNGILIGAEETKTWEDIIQHILTKPRTASINRKTKETEIAISVNIDEPGKISVNTGIGFFDHMLEQINKHAGISTKINVSGDLRVDDHHTVEDTALALGSAIKKALGDKLGIARYGFVLPMDESQSSVMLDLSGRGYCKFSAEFSRESVGGLSTELVPHFFRSFADALQATLHINVEGENNHHMIESLFKCVGRTLRQAIKREGFELPTTKGTL